MQELFKEIKKYYSDAVYANYGREEICIPYLDSYYSITVKKIPDNDRSYIRLKEPVLDKDTKKRNCILWVSAYTGKDCSSRDMVPPQFPKDTSKLHKLIREFYAPNSIRFIRSFSGI